MSDRYQSANAGSGAAKGLEKKLQFFRDKDYQFEYGVTIGQAFNIATEISAGAAPSREKVLAIFDMLLSAKLDPAFVEKFDDYFSKKKMSFNDGEITIKQ